MKIGKGNACFVRNELKSNNSFFWNCWSLCRFEKYDTFNVIKQYKQCIHRVQFPKNIYSRITVPTARRLISG
jgi:hypothetical protein